MFTACSKEKYFSAVFLQFLLVCLLLSKLINLDKFIRKLFLLKSFTIIPVFFSFRMNSVSPIPELVIQGIPQAKNSPNLVGLEAFFE